MPNKPPFGQPPPSRCERCGFEWRAGAITQMWKRDELGRAICRFTAACDVRALHMGPTNGTFPDAS